MSSSSSSPSLAPNIVVLDPDSNLLIITRSPQKSRPFHFRVSSKVLSLASPIFASLFPDSASHTRQYQIILDDDHPEPVGALLELCHFGRTTPLPPAQLSGVNALAEASLKYAISAPLVPWVTSWSQMLHDNDRLDFGKGGELKQWLRVCCVYGQDMLFSKVTKRAVLTGNAESLDVSKSPEAPYNDIIAQIALKRIEVLVEIIEIVLTLLSKYQTTETTCRQPTNSAQCDAIRLGSVLKGLMGLGVYQPTPMAPYPGMTVVDLIQKIKNLPLMVDPSHGETCGEVINEDICRILRLAHEVSDRVKGLQLGDFAANQRVGKVHGLVLTVVEGQDTKRQDQHSRAGSEKEKEKERIEGDRGGDGEKRAEKQQEEGEVKKEGKKVECGGGDNNGEKDKVECGGGDNNGEKYKGGGESDGLADIVIRDSASESGDVLSADLHVPAGAFAGFLETPETLKDFGPQALFEDKTTSLSAREMSDGGGREGKEKYLGRGSNATQEDRLTNEQGLELKQKHPVHSENKEEPKPTSKDYTSSKIQGQPPTSSSERGEMKALQNVHTKHAMSRANAEAHGHKWSVPGPELVQKYQRGPRFPFHPTITVGDISDEDHTTEIKRLRDLFPQVDTKILVEFLRQGGWSSQTAADMLRAGGILMNPGNGIGDGPTPAPSFPILKPTILSPLGFASTTHQETDRNSIVLPKVSPSAPAPTNKAAPASATSPKRAISITRLVAGKLSTGQSEARFWSVPDREVVMRSLALPENKKAIRKLLAMFPQASADKGFIDVLYRSGWDTEKAARRLESLGLVRDVGGTSGDDEKAMSKSMGNEML